jgi:hypothetical protein
LLLSCFLDGELVGVVEDVNGRVQADRALFDLGAKPDPEGVQGLELTFNTPKSNNLSFFLTRSTKNYSFFGFVNASLLTPRACVQCRQVFSSNLVHMPERFLPKHVKNVFT